MATFTNCLQIVNAMPEQDQDALLTRLDELQARGMRPKEAQLQAAIDVLAQVEREGRKSADRYVTAKEISEMERQAFVRLQGDGKYKALTEKIAEAEEAGSKRFNQVVDKAVEILKSRPGFKKTSDEYDAKTVRNLARVFMDEADGLVPEATPSLRDATQARQDYVEQYLKDAGIPEPREFSDRANQDRGYYDSSAFRRWFKSSKAVDANGRPLVAFHVTTKDFVEFDTNAGKTNGQKSTAAYSGQLGSWFTAPSLYSDNYEPGNAEAAVEGFIEDNDGNAKPGAVTMPVHLSIQNPMEYSDFESMLEDRDSYPSIAKFKADLVSQGHDGIIIRNSDTDGAVDRDDWVAFEPTQIKSATGNSGAFDPANPDIRKSADRTWRGDGYRALNYNPPKNATVADVVRYESEELGNEDIGELADESANDLGVDLSSIPASDAIWVTRTVEQAMEYGDRSDIKKYPVKGWLILADLGDEGALLLNPKHAQGIRKSTDRVTDTPAFKRWFGDSKVVNENGKPLVVYHATDEKFDEFYVGQYGSHFGSKDAAIFRANELDGDDVVVMPVHLSIQNPLRLRDPDGGDWAQNENDNGALDQMVALGLITKSEAATITLKNAVERAGHDGVVYDNAYEGGGDSYIVFRPEQIKSATGNNGEFGDTGNIYKSVDRPQFYSQLQRAIEGVPDRIATMAAPQWKLWLDSNGPKLGVKKEEIEWSGIKDYLDLQGKKKLSKDDLSAYLDDSGVKVSEVELGGDLSGKMKPFTTAQNPGGLGYVVLDNNQPNFPNGRIADGPFDEEWEADRRTERLNEDLEEGEYSGWSTTPETNLTKYSKYTLPGGTNYREVLITLPESIANANVLATGTNKTSGKPFVSFEFNGDRYVVERNQDETDQQAINRRINAMPERGKISGTNTYKSTHWDQKNVLAHIRINDRTTQEIGYVARNFRSGFVSQVFATPEEVFAFQATLPESVKTEVVEHPRFVRVLFVEEAQSDRGQDGKKKGFAEPEWWVELSNGNKEYYKNEQEAKRIARENNTEANPVTYTAGKVPTAPFVTKTEGWLNLALKRIAMMAVEGGYDKVAFVNGEQSADRYDLSKQVKELYHWQDGERYGVSAYDMDDRAIIDQEYFTADQLEDAVGKEVAKKIVDRQGTPEGDDGVLVLSGDGLKVGGEGMKTFYDQIVPQALNKLLPKIGGEKLGSVAIGDEGSAAESRNLTMKRSYLNPESQKFKELTAKIEELKALTLQQPGFDVTDKMRETVGAGLPLFSRDRVTDTPAFKRWFADSVMTEDGKPGGEPLVLYHGGFDFAQAPDGKAMPKVSGRGSLGVGFYMTPDEDRAREYAEDNSGAVSSLYVRMERPLEIRLSRGQDPMVEALVALGLDRDKAARKVESAYEKYGYVGSEVKSLALNKGYDGLVEYIGNKMSEVVVWNPTQVKSATNNDGGFSWNPDIRKSADRPWFEDLSKLKVSTNYQLGDLLKSSKKLSWWDRTVGTQYNLATKQPEFKRVFDAVQTFINDISAYATRAADMAPTILPKLESFKDIVKQPMTPEDVAALRDPVFGGTLKYARDENGELIETDDVQKAGVVFTDEELKTNFKLTDEQIGLYRQFRKSVDQSVTDLALSDMVRYLGEDGRDIAETVMASGNVDVAVGVIESHLADLVNGTPQRAEVLGNTIEAIKQKGEQANRLMDRGYAPLSRFGQYTTYVVGKDGEQLYFGMFENERDAQKMAREMREQYPDATVSTSTMSQESYKLFSGVTTETLALFGDSLGLEESGIDTKSEVFQQYLKVAKTNRSAMKRLIERKGIDGFSEDAGRVLAGFVYSNARQISTNLHAGEIGKAAADVKDGDVKDAAIRLMEYIQNPQEEAQALRGLLFTQFIGGSIASALVNMTQPFTMTAPYLAQFDGVTGASRRMADAMKLVTKGVRNDADLQDALRRAEDLGIVSPQEVHQLMAQARGRGSLITGDGTKMGDAAAKANNFTAKLGLAWGKAFSAAEQFNRRITFIAAYKLARDKGMADPMAFAQQTIAETQGIYNKGNKPVWARGAIGGTLFTFKQYSISYVEFLRRMWGNGPEGKKAVGLALGVLFMSAGLGGMPGADDMDDVIDGFAQRVLGKSFDSKQAKKEFFASILGQSGAEFVMTGLTGLPGAPIDLSGRLGLGNLIPGTGIFTKKSEYGRDVAEIFGPAGSLFKQVATGAGKLAQGDVAGAAKEVAPVAAQNVIKSVDMAVMGMYRDTKGRKVIDTEPWEAVAKAVGFQPATVKRVQDATGTQQNLIGQNKLRETEIADKWAAGRIERNPGKVEEAKAELAEWNRKNPQSPINIDASQINRRVQQAMMEKAKRLEKTAPKEIRQSVRQELERASN
jgi:hypothetical protein